MDSCGYLWEVVDMFLGEYYYNLDSKDRIAIPVSFRKKLGSRGVITRGIDNCLFLFPKEEWKKLVKKILTLPIGQPNSRAFMRLMFAGAKEVEIDSLGRILIPDYLKKFAKLKKGVAICGLFSRIEIWDKATWERYKKETEKESQKIAQTLEI